MICKICNSEKIKKIEQFKPYLDVSFEFDIYDCLNCHTRFAESTELDNDKSILHSDTKSPYIEHYKKAKSIKQLIDNDLSKCENELLENDMLFQKVFSHIESLKDKNISILEIGCSTGYITAFLQAKGYKNAFGIDISYEPIEYAKELFGNYYATKEESKKYDIIFFTGVIGCVTSPIDFLNYYLNLLTPNGMMFFNAPNVDSVKETNEIWVSSPPPDVIFLFEKNSFLMALDNKYKIKCYKTFTPANILYKYINAVRNRKNNKYPRNFYIKNTKHIELKKSYFKDITKKFILLVVEFLVKIKILNKYSDEYGLIYQIKSLEGK